MKTKGGFMFKSLGTTVLEQDQQDTVGLKHPIALVHCDLEMDQINVYLHELNEVSHNNHNIVGIGLAKQ
jgi:hypothetical protein